MVADKRPADGPLEDGQLKKARLDSNGTTKAAGNGVADLASSTKERLEKARKALELQKALKEKMAKIGKVRRLKRLSRPYI
jgi:hypothetical protein